MTEEIKSYTGQERRKTRAKPLKKGERRADLQIISSVNQTDIYIWAVSVAIMLAIIVFFITIVFLKV